MVQLMVQLNAFGAEIAGSILTRCIYSIVNFPSTQLISVDENAEMRVAGRVCPAEFSTR